MQPHHATSPLQPHSPVVRELLSCMRIYFALLCLRPAMCAGYLHRRQMLLHPACTRQGKLKPVTKSYCVLIPTAHLRLPAQTCGSAADLHSQVLIRKKREKSWGMGGTLQRICRREGDACAAARVR